MSVAPIRSNKAARGLGVKSIAEPPYASVATQACTLSASVSWALAYTVK